MAWGKNGTPDTLGSAGDVMTISDMSANKFNTIMTHQFMSGADTGRRRTFNSNSNSVYARRYNANGGTDGTGVSQTYWELGLGDGDDFSICYLCSISGEEKLGIMFVINQVTAGAGTAPQRLEFVGKFVPSPDADITRIDCNNTAAGSFNTSSNISALGSDMTPAAGQTATISDGAIFYETDNNKSYVLYNGSWTEV